MALKDDKYTPKSGMNRSSHPGELKGSSYSFAYNAQKHNEQGNGRLMLQNETSNIKCSQFKEGFFVVGGKFDVNSYRTFFFLHNPETQVSEIGFINVFQEAEENSPNEIYIEQTIFAEEEIPLERQNQAWKCTYNTLVNDECDGKEGCLNFSLNDPIHEENIIIKYGLTGETLWFFHSRNPGRYLQLDNLSIYTQTEDKCDDTIETHCLDCEKMRIFKRYSIPTLKVNSVQNGGSLRAGMYEIWIANSTEKGEAISDFYGQTNQIPIHDENNTILDQTSLDYLTNIAISVDVINIDPSWEFYTIAVVYTDGLSAATTFHKYGVFPAERKSITIDDITGKERITSQQLKARYPSYETAGGATTANGYLYQYNLTQRTLKNLQPVVNLMGSFIKWAAGMAKENLYKDPAACATSKSFMRDEVYGLAINFEIDGGEETPVFPFIGRPAMPMEMHELGTPDYPTNFDTDSINQYDPKCFESERTKRWQYENRASVDGQCYDDEGTGTPVNITEEITCTVSEENGDITVVDTINIGSVTTFGETSIVGFINNNYDYIVNSSDPELADIKSIIDNHSDYPESCDPPFSENCQEPYTLQSGEIFPIEVKAENTYEVLRPLSYYERSAIKTDCGVITLGSSGLPEKDTTFETNFMLSNENVYQRASLTNNQCNVAKPVLPYTNPQQTDSNHLLNKGALNNVTGVQTALNSNTDYFYAKATLTGSGGEINIEIDGQSYSLPFQGTLSNTAAFFVTTYATTINIDHQLVVTSIGADIYFRGPYTTFENITVLQVIPNLNASILDRYFTRKIHTNAIWLKVDLSTGVDQVFEIGTGVCNYADDNTGNMVRVSFYEDCVGSIVPSYTTIIEDITDPSAPGKLHQILVSDFPNGFAYIVIDSPVRKRVISSTDVFTLTPPCNCFPTYTRNAETTVKIDFVDLTFGKSQTYASNCTYFVPKVTDCAVVPYQTGKFGYTESTERYPCNDELFDSSSLKIAPSDIPDAYQAQFEDYFTNGLQNGNYIMTDEANFRDKPIRHFKFPDNKVSPFMSPESMAGQPFSKALIFPIGITIDNNLVRSFLDIAVKNNLITAKERNRIKRYNIFRTDRRNQKTVVSKGIMFDMFQYQEQGNIIHYPNYPLNALGRDDYNSTSHPYASVKNNSFSYHSPDTEFFKPTLTRELRIEGYLFGHSGNEFDEVKDHPKMVILGNKAYTLASTLAGLEVLFEVFLQTADWAILASASTVPSAVAVGFAVAAIVLLVIQSVFQVGKKRYEWLNIFRNLGAPRNFAYYHASLGHYNVFKPNIVGFQSVRGLAVSQYVRPGYVQANNESDQLMYNINADRRENFVYLHLGNFFLIFRNDYSNYDKVNGTGNTSGNGSSRPYYFRTGRSGRLVGKASSPYVAMKQFLPKQYGTIDSIDWVKTGPSQELDTNNFCEITFGGDIFISRFALRRKMPLYSNDAFGLADLTPFKYSDYHNINPDLDNPLLRYFVDYETAEGSFPLGFLAFPDKKTDYRFIGSNNDEVFYVKPPNKILLYSYGIPYFLVESEINCNFRYGRPGKLDNFYPNIQDIIDWTQEKNLPINSPNTFFYNQVYSNRNLQYPYITLPSIYDRELYTKLNDLSDTVIYSLQDTSENSIYDPWLRYRGLDAARFSKKFGNLIGLDGIESLQLLARSSNGFTIFGAVDTLRDRLTPETGNLGTGGIFNSRPLDFNTTKLGYAGTQNRALISTEFGHFFVDAMRGAVFMVGAGGKGVKEISKGSAQEVQLEKWFKDSLPFQILKSTPNANIDNAWNGIGIAMGWDSLQKRLFLTKKDYRLKRPLSYEDGRWYSNEELECPKGYVRVGDTCERRVVSEKTPDSDPLNAVVPTNLSPYGFLSPALYSSYNANGTALGIPGNYTYQSLTAPFWTAAPLNYVQRLAKWVNSGSSNTDDGIWYGGAALINIERAGVYHVFLAADNLFRFKINGAVVVESAFAAMTVQHGNIGDTVCFRKGHIYPIELQEGCQTITIEGKDLGQLGMFAGAIFNNTASELINATTLDDLNVLFSTRDVDLFYPESSTYVCPEGFEAEGEGPCDDCLLLDIIPIPEERNYIPLTDKNYFEDVSWTIAYDPIEDNWISYYAFKPNYYFSYNEYFQTGINVTNNLSQKGIWSHLPFISSYQVFYGELHPFIVEYAMQSKGYNSVLNDIEIWLDVRKYYNKYDFVNVVNKGFDKLVVYNPQQNTGYLRLVHQIENDLSQIINYPQYDQNGATILQTEMNGKFNINNLSNHLKEERSLLPAWINDPVNILKTIDNRVMQYEDSFKDYLRGDYFQVRFYNETESRYKMILRLAGDNRDYYE